jgi:formylmethanofuran dehydrogenase subunit E
MRSVTSTSIADRLMDANQEALEAIERMLDHRMPDHEGERRGFVDDEAETAWEAEHLEETLVDVRDILGGASEDVRGLLEGSGE